MRACVEMPSYLIMINGAPYGHFKGRRWIIQGDPMSLYLFVMVMELFIEITRDSVRAGKFTPHYRSEDPINISSIICE